MPPLQFIDLDLGGYAPSLVRLLVPAQGRGAGETGVDGGPHFNQLPGLNELRSGASVALLPSAGSGEPMRPSSCFSATFSRARSSSWRIRRPHPSVLIYCLFSDLAHHALPHRAPNARDRARATPR